MTYEMFKEIVIQKIKEYLPPDWQNAKIERIEYMKTNYKNDAISFVKDEKGLAFGPNISVKDWYKRYQQGDKLEEILEEIANLVVRAERDAIPFKGIFNEDRYKGIIKDNLCLKLINTKQNQELLQNLPHKEFNDLSIICTWIVEGNAELQGNCNITYSLLDMLEMSEEELFERARANTERIMPPVVMSMDEVIKKQLGMEMGEVSEQPSMLYVLTNEGGYFGATTVLFTDEVDKLAQRVGEDLYLIPSSVHEFLAIPQSVMDSESIQGLVFEVNTQCVEIDERLSNEVYQYDRSSRQVTLATDCQEKSLDDLQELPDKVMCVADKAR